MKKNLVLLLFLAFFMGLTACSGEDEKIDPPDPGENPGDGGEDPDPEKPTVLYSYYVSPSGNDTNSGNLENPMKTIGKALLRANPGDTIFLREGVYNEFVVPHKSGEKGKEITIKSYKKEVGKIDGTGLDTNGFGNALVRFKNISYFTLENVHICNAVNTEKNADPEGVYITGTSNNITLRGCSIYNIKNTCLVSGNGDWRSAHAILVIGYDLTPIRNLLIEKCDIYDIETGTSETLSLVGNVVDFVIQDNKVHDVENIGIIVAGGDNFNPSGDVSVNYARDGVIRRNKVYNCSHQNTTEYWGEDGYGAIGIYVCGGANTIIEQNEVWGCDRGIGLVSESDILPTRDCVVRNNVVYNNYRTGIYMGDYIGYTIGGTSGCYVLNNTLYNNNWVGGAYNGYNNSENISDINSSEGELRLSANCTNNTIMNNIVYSVTDRDIFVRKYNQSGSNNIVDYNIYYSTNSKNHKWIWDGREYSTFAAYQRASGDNHSVFNVDPKLRNPNPNNPDFQLQTGSPAVNAGHFINAYFHGSLDLAGNPRYSGTSISIGAYQ